MTKEELIRAIITRKDFRFTHEEMMHMNTQQLREIYNNNSPCKPCNCSAGHRQPVIV